MADAGVCRRLRGHNDSVLSCACSPSSPHLLMSASEDGSVCVFDLRNSTLAHKLEYFGGQAVVSVIPKPGHDDFLYAAAGSDVYCLDLRQGPTGSPLHTYTFNREEINQVALNQKCTYLAAADDSGETKIIDLRTHKVFKTLQGIHSNICSAVQFHTRKPWEVITGGLDSKIAKWDFNRGRPMQVVDLASGASSSSEGVGRICNPPFVHALAVVEGETSGDAGKLVAVARGDGAVDVFDMGLEICSYSKRSSKKKATSLGALSKTVVGDMDLNEKEKSDLDSLLPGRRRHLHSGIGGHASIVNHVSFARFGDKGRFLISGGNDTYIKLWDWALQDKSVTPKSLNTTNNDGPLIVNIKHKRKVNWLSTTSAQRENLIVADTSKVLSIYNIL